MSSTLLALKNAEVFSSSTRLDAASKFSGNNASGSIEPLISDSQASDLFNETGFMFGDGYFDTMLFEKNHVPLWKLHRDRILVSAKRLAFTNTEEQRITFEHVLDLSYTRVCEAIKRYGFDNGSGLIVKVIITGGELSIGSYPHPNSIPNIYIVVRRLTRSKHAPDVTLRLSLLPLPHNRVLSGIKHLSRSNYILSAKHALGPESDLIDRHVLFLDTEKNVIESMHHNIFIVVDGILKTPRLDKVGVSGVMRRCLVDALYSDPGLAKGVGLVEECDVNIETLCIADEVFLSNAVDGLVRVKSLEIPKVYRAEESLDVYQLPSEGMVSDFKYISYNTSVMPVFDMLSKCISKELK